jgi:hypothetical protein
MVKKQSGHTNMSGIVQKILKRVFSKETLISCGKRKEPKRQCALKPLYLPIPFISDSFNRKIRWIFKDFTVPIHIYNYGNTSLRQYLSKSKKKIPVCTKRNCLIKDNKRCFLFNVVYSVKCCTCQQEYIGSTSRDLHDRIQQHLFPSTNSAISEHLLTCGTKDHLFISVISRHKNIIDTRLAESIAIYRRNPRLNRKNECESSVAIIQHYTDILNSSNNETNQ